MTDGSRELFTPKISGRSESGDGKDTAVGHDESWSEDIVDGMRFVRDMQTKVR